ncbi:MAG: T9SS type A sorting domain-containing protein [Bacteroidetes bacterium]|nr:T9SS type A sorting domain-containing protein [Bacteroidota bacterium]MBX7238807.1 T9SS type A sorting domain-containing protein [Bacteroidia bacterium]MCC7514613.1 T9SS type A sorting domain-containing protein [Bacteroidia bacterium]HMU77010.1 T9SS type A sorting domain-containing protein [Bacteroidia bacterium]HMW09173.1 T9SS type A sorting domain-containing protein [Bacteroidia bacterium]
MSKKALIISTILVLMYNLHYGQQGINNNWLMGYSSWGGSPFGQTRMNFFNGAPTISYDSLEMDFNHTHANISDAIGNMMFYTNGYYLADATNDTMQNGSGLSPGAYANAFSDGFGIPQGALIIPKPNSSNLYYLFHNSADGYSQPIPNSISYNFYVTTIDMNVNGGLGTVLSKNVSLLTDSMNPGKIAATKHANGRDWWVMIHRVNTNKFYKFLVTPNVILGPYSQNIGVIRGDGAGQAWFSPDGKKYAYYYVNDGLDIFDFDRCTATLSNAVHVNMPFENGYNVGMAISPGSNALYVSNTQHVYQFDLTAANIAASQLTVATYDSFVSVFPGFPNGFATLFGLSALAPDGKIYITTGNSTIHMHTIDNPDVIGLGCNVNQHSVQLQSVYFNTLPNHPNYFLGCDTTCTTCLVGVPSLTPEGVMLRASPNPNNGNFTLQFNVQSTAGELEIYDVMGKMVMRNYVAPWSQYKRVDITQLKKGIYFCKLKWKHTEQSLKVIKE